jgi:DNA-binding FadR family transcriptional regulator
VHEQLRLYLVRHRLRPGDRLPSEGELAREIGTSRVTVRQGLGALELLGLLDSRAGSGWYVRTFDVSHATRVFAFSLAYHSTALLDLLDARRALESEMLTRVAGRLTEAQLGVLDELADRMRWRAARGQLFTIEDAQFHRAIAAASGNQVARALVDLYWSVLGAMYEHGFPGPAVPELAAAAESHVQLLTALRRGDGATAGVLLREKHSDLEFRLRAWQADQELQAARRDVAEPPAPDRENTEAAPWSEEVRAIVEAALLGSRPDRLVPR